MKNQFKVQRVRNEIYVVLEDVAVGRVSILPGFYYAVYAEHHEGAQFKSEQAAINYLIGEELRIDAAFEGRYDVEECAGVAA